MLKSIKDFIKEPDFPTQIVLGYTIFFITCFLIFMPIPGSAIFFMVVNYVFVFSILYFALTFTSKINLIAFINILNLFFIIRMFALVSYSSYIFNRFDNPFSSEVINNAISTILVLLVVCIALFYYLHNYLENVILVKNTNRQLKFKNHFCEALSLLKLEFFIVIIAFIFNVFSIYIYENVVNNNCEAVFTAFSLSSVVLIVAMVPVIAITTSLILIAKSYYNNDYLKHFKSNLKVLLLNKNSLINFTLMLMIFVFLPIVIALFHLILRILGRF